MADDEMTRAERILAGERRLDAATPKLPAEATRAERMLAEESLAYANKLLDAAVVAGDKQRIVTMAEDGIVPPGYALMAIEVVQYDSQIEDRTRSVWLADRAKFAATSPVRMTEVFESIQESWAIGQIEPANKEPMAKLSDAVWTKELDGMFTAYAEATTFSCATDDPGEEPLLSFDEERCSLMLREDEQTRPVLRLGEGLKL